MGVDADEFMSTRYNSAVHIKLSMATQGKRNLLRTR